MWISLLVETDAIGLTYSTVLDVAMVVAAAAATNLLFNVAAFGYAVVW